MDVGDSFNITYTAVTRAKENIVIVYDSHIQPRYECVLNENTLKLGLQEVPNTIIRDCLWPRPTSKRDFEEMSDCKFEDSADA